MTTLLIGLTLAAAVAYSVHRMFRIFNAWTRNVKLAQLLPHIEDWSYIYGTYKPRADEGQLSEVAMRLYAESTERFEKLFSVFLGPMLVASAVAVHPEAVQAVLKRNDGKSPKYEFIRLWLGDGLLLSKGAKWQRNRKLLTPAFHFGILKTYMSVFNEAADVLLDKLSHHCRSDVGYWDVATDVGLASLDIILQCAFTSKTDCQISPDHDYAKAVRTLTELSFQRVFSPWLWRRIDALYWLTSDGRRYSKALSVVHGHSRTIIEARKKELDSQRSTREAAVSDDDISKPYKDFLDLLLEVKDADGKPMSDEDIKAEADTFLFEGHDTTKAAMSWILYMCAKHPDHQQILHEEIDALFDGRSSDHLTWNDICKLDYTTLFIKEAMRLCPPVPSISRKADEEIQICGRHLAKGSDINIMVYALHHNRHVWGDDVEEFKPERFSFENVDKIHPYAYIPFSAGQRNCIGQNLAMSEMKVVIARVLRKFVVRPHPTIIPKPAFALTLGTVPDHPIFLKLEARA